MAAVREVGRIGDKPSSDGVQMDVSDDLAKYSSESMTLARYLLCHSRPSTPLLRLCSRAVLPCSRAIVRQSGTDPVLMTTW